MFSFAGLAARGGRTGHHADGWGLALYEGKAARIFREPAAAAEAYRAADGALLLPLHEPMEVFSNRREVGLVARAVTRDREEIHQQCGLSEGQPLVYLGGGQSLNHAIFRGIRTALAGCTLLVPSWTDLPGAIGISRQSFGQRIAKKLRSGSVVQVRSYSGFHPVFGIVSHP